MPPIHPIMNRVREMRARGETVYSMAQAVPWYGPPEEAMKEFMAEFETAGFNFYSPDPGLLSARTALTDDFRNRRSIDLDPGSELHLTCGASQAFVSALMSVADQGERVVVLEPYYFDHVFAVQFSGLELDSIPMTEGESWQVPWNEVEKRIPGAAAMVLVNPGNPTGTALSREELRKIVKITGEHRCALIVDETYQQFNFTGSTWHPWEEKQYSHVLTLGSFSKSYSLSGWRLGYLFGSENILTEALKVQDSVVICPPTPSQILLEKCLQYPEWVNERSREVEKRLNLCRKAMMKSQGLQWREPGGGFFTLAGIPEGINSYKLAEKLIDEFAIATIPGDAFGESGRGHLRFSFGCLSEEQLEPAMEALASVVIAP